MSEVEIKIKNINFIIHNPELSKEIFSTFEYAIYVFEHNPRFKIKELQDILGFFQQIDIYFIKDKKSSIIAYSDTEKKIKVNVEKLLYLILEMDKKKVLEKVQEALIHEITHKFHNEKTSCIELFRKRNNKLKKKLQPSIFGKVFSIKKSNFLREELNEVFNRIYFEGLATYVQYIGKKTNFQILQKEVLETILQIKHNKDNYKSNNYNLITRGFDLQKIGFLMTYVILINLYSNIKLNDLFEMGFKKFILEYEKSCTQLNLEILISYSSNIGILDYQNLIQEWKESKRNKN